MILYKTENGFLNFEAPLVIFNIEHFQNSSHFKQPVQLSKAKPF